MPTKSIMVVDDEQDTLKLLEKSLAAEGYAVTSVTSAKTMNVALSLAAPRVPDLIILDLSLPDLDGQAIAARLKENPATREIPVLFLTARYSDREVRERNHLLDGNVMFAKPYDREELAAAVRELLDGKKKILIVDDEQDLLTVLGMGLRAKQYNVIKAATGAEAIKRAKTEQPDLIILDLEMSDIYGGDVARMLGEDPSTCHIPVMFLTGMFPKEGEGSEGRRVGGHVLFAKPYETPSLVSAIKRLI